MEGSIGLVLSGIVLCTQTRNNSLVGDRRTLRLRENDEFVLFVTSVFTPHSLQSSGAKVY